MDAVTGAGVPRDRSERPAVKLVAGRGAVCHRNGARDLVLQIKQLLDFYVEVIGPQNGFRFGIDQLNPNAHTLARSAQAAAEQIAYAQTTADFSGGTGLKTEQEGGVPRNDHEIAEAA